MPNRTAQRVSERAPSSRVERKRQEARARIVEAAESLFRARGVDAVTIADITTAADVGHGSFYLHFNSKHEVLLPVLIAKAAEIDANVQRALGEEADPADVLASSARFMGYAVVSDPLWRWFLGQSGLPHEVMRRAFGRFGQRDLDRGLASGRFNAPNLRTTAIFCFGGYVSVLMAAIELDDPVPLVDGAAEAMLRLLGLPDEEARRIAHRSLEDLR